jgi:hypothetical protein
MGTTKMVHATLHQGSETLQEVSDVVDQTDGQGDEEGASEDV